MRIFTIACYVASSIVFFAAILPSKIQPRSLDLLALGLFLFTLPYVIDKVNDVC